MQTKLTNIYKLNLIKQLKIVQMKNCIHGLLMLVKNLSNDRKIPNIQPLSKPLLYFC